MKGQSSLEFLAMISMSAVVVAALYGSVGTKQVDTVQYNNGRDAVRIAEKLGFQVEMAMVHGEGYSRVFSLPESIGGKNYSATFREGFVVMNYLGQNITRSTLYEGRKIQLSTDTINTFRVLNNETGIYIREVS